jgi:hypothetical protein
VVPDYTRTEQRLNWMPSSTFRSPLRLAFAVEQAAARSAA